MSDCLLGLWGGFLGLALGIYIGEALCRYDQLRRYRKQAKYRRSHDVQIDWEEVFIGRTR